jgi:hypothetical protein
MPLSTNQGKVWQQALDSTRPIASQGSLISGFGADPGRITACRVVVKDPGQHHRTSGLFEVHIHLSLPDRKEVNVGHKPDADERHSDVHSAINDAFKHTQRILEEDVRRMQGDLKTHVPRRDAQTSD